MVEQVLFITEARIGLANIGCYMGSYGMRYIIILEVWETALKCILPVIAFDFVEIKESNQAYFTKLASEPP